MKEIYELANNLNRVLNKHSNNEVLTLKEYPLGEIK